MKTVRVSTPTRSYDVMIGSGILKDLGTVVRSVTSAGRCILVSGENVFPLYGEIAMQSLRDAGLAVNEIVFPSGEKTKCMACYEELLNFAANCQITRSDCFIALGGGVTGDLTGFAAATWQRGIPYIQIPTTLLAAVDSSVGGKTAVNLHSGKNQVGAFWQPSAVLCDTQLLDTLPPRETAAGCAEVIKYAVLGDADLFESLRCNDSSVEDIIETCVRMKAEIVGEDEFDNGQRRMLNLGHSFGHAVEQKSDYELLHGEAVAIGLAMICRAAFRQEMMDAASRDAVIELLKSRQLPTECPYSPEELYPFLFSDKKISAGCLHLIVPNSIGWCSDVPVSAEDLREWLVSAYE